MFSYIRTAFGTIIHRKKYILSFQYIILIFIIDSLRFIFGERMLYFLMPSDSAWILRHSGSVIFRTISIYTLVSFINTLCDDDRDKNSMRFLPVKNNLFYFLCVMITAVLPYELIDCFVFNRFFDLEEPYIINIADTVFLKVLFTAIYLLINEFVKLMAYYKAVNADDTYKNTLYRVFEFIKSHLLKYVLFNLSLTLVILIPYIIAYYAFNGLSEKLEIFNVLFSATHYGIDIIFTPLFYLSFHYFNNALDVDEN